MGQSQRMSVSKIFLVAADSAGGGAVPPADPFCLVISPDFIVEPGIDLGRVVLFPGLLCARFNPCSDPCTVELSGTRRISPTSAPPLEPPPSALAVVDAFEAKLLSEPVFLRSLRKPRGICPRLSC